MLGEFERRLSKAEFAFVEHKLFNYPTNKQLLAEYEDMREDIISGTKHKEKGMPQNQGVGKPVESTVAQLLMLEERVKGEAFWVRAIEDTLDSLEEEDKKLVQLKYFDGYLTNVGVAMRLGLDERDFYRRRERIVFRFAKRFGII